MTVHHSDEQWNHIEQDMGEALYTFSRILMAAFDISEHECVDIMQSILENVHDQILLDKAKMN